MPDLSPEALERAKLTQRAAVVFGAHAEAIANSVMGLPAEHVSVAVVNAEFEFLGTHRVAHAQLVERVPALEGEGGWAMVFSHAADAEHVRTRAEEMASLAGQRAAAIERITSRPTT